MYPSFNLRELELECAVLCFQALVSLLGCAASLRLVPHVRLVAALRIHVVHILPSNSVRHDASEDLEAVL